MRAVRYFLSAWALRIVGAANATEAAMEPLRKVRRLMDMIISPFSS
jgi:hypothetical protein